MGSEWQSERERGKPARCIVYKRVKGGEVRVPGAYTQTNGAGRSVARAERSPTNK